VQVLMREVKSHAVSQKTQNTVAASSSAGVPEIALA